MGNILEAICNIQSLEKREILNLTAGNNRMNNAGDGLELFVKDAFSNNFNSKTDAQKDALYGSIFSYTGSSTTPPDLMIRGGDAIEVKKTNSIGSDLQLNSSHPKSKLTVKSSLINTHCKNCEDWTEKDIIYTVGHVKLKKLSSLWLVYGSLYAADEETYLKLKTTVTKGLKDRGYDGFNDTKELARINNVDPLKITNLRVRGMWLLKPPVKVFSYLYNYSVQHDFQLVAIIPTEKYNSFPNESRQRIENLTSKNLKIDNVEVKNPNNPVEKIEAKLITIII